MTTLARDLYGPKLCCFSHIYLDGRPAMGESQTAMTNSRSKPSQVLLLTVERQRRGWSGLEMGRRSKNAPSDISRWEHGRAIPYDRQLRRIARALGWRIADAHRLLAPVVADDYGDGGRPHAETMPPGKHRRAVN